MATKEELDRILAQLEGRAIPETSEEATALLDRLETMSISGGPEAAFAPPVPAAPSRIIQSPSFGTFTVGPTRKGRAEALGLDVETGSPIEARLAASAGTIEDVKRQLSERFGGAEIDIGEVEGIGLVFKNPETQQFQLLNPPGADIGDIGPALLEAPVIGAEVLAGAAALRTGSPSAVVGAGATAAGVVRGAEIAVLEKLGIISDASPVIEGLKEAGLSIGGGVLPSVARGARALVSPKTRAIAGLSEQIDPDKLAAGRALGEPEISPDVEFSTGEILSRTDPERGAIIRNVERELGGEQEIARVAARRIELERLRSEVGQGAENVAEQAGVQEAAAAEARRRAESIIDTAEQQRQVLQGEIESFSGVGRIEGGETIQSQLKAGRDAVFEQVGEGYEMIGAGLGDATIDLAPLRRAAEGIAKEKRIFPVSPKTAQTIKAGQRAGLEPVGAPIEDTFDPFKDFPPDFDGLPVPQKFAVVQRGLSDIRDQMRALKAGVAPKKEILELQTLHDGLLKARNDAIKDLDPELHDILLDLERQYAQAKTVVDGGLVGALIKKDASGRFVISSDAALRNVLRSAGDIREYRIAMQNFPQIDATSAIKKAFRGKYVDEVIEGGANHQRFMTNNRTVMDEIFTPAEKKTFNSPARAKAGIARIDKLEELELKKINAAFGEDLAEYTPESALAFIAKEPTRKGVGAAQKTTRLRGILGKNSDKWKAYQATRRANLINEISDAQGNVTLSNLDTVLNRQGDELTAAFGPKYVTNLKSMRAILRVEAKRPSVVSPERGPLAPPTTSSEFDAARAVLFGPLSRAGFITRVLRRVGVEQSKKSMRKMLQDPELLEQGIRLHRTRANNKKYVNFLSMLGISIPANLVAAGQEPDVSQLTQEKFEATFGEAQ